MNTKRDTTSVANSNCTRFRRRIERAPLALLAPLALVLTVTASADTRPPATIPFSEIGARATARYQGDALSVTATTDGARLRCGFQKLEGHATTEGLWLESTKPGAAGRLRLVAQAVGREVLECGSPLPLSLDPSGPQSGRGLPRSMTLARWSPLLAVLGDEALPTTGGVSVADNLVRFTRPGLTEEYSVSVDGVRQDFVITAPPAGAGDLRVELFLSGARAEAAASGARFRLDGSGRALAYSRLRVKDATGRELTARLEVLSADRLAVCVADGKATYPVRIDPTFSDADWVSLSPGLPGTNPGVYAIATDGSGNVYVGGAFTLVGTVPANRIAKWDGTAWSALGSGMDVTVHVLAVSGSDLYAGGQFTTAGGVPATYIAKWDGSAWSALGSGCNSYVYALAVSGSDLYAGGTFGTAGGVPANGIAKWNGSAWSALGSGINVMKDGVDALAVSGTTLYMGGSFTNVGGVSANNIAKWDGSTWSALGSGLKGGVGAMALSGTDLYVGGGFTAAGGVAANGIAKWNGSAWSALGSGINGSVNALAVSATDLYAGGWFFTAGGATANFMAKWDGNAWSALGSGMNDGVNALAVSGANLYAGGGFTTAGGVLANAIAKWNGNVWSAFGSGMSSSVHALALSGTNLYAGGESGVATWNGSAWSALGSGWGGYNSLVSALAVGGTDLYAGGTFTTVGGGPANYIAKWNGSVWSALGSGMNSRVNALAVSGTNLYAGGRFTTAGGVTANYIAKWNGSAWSALGSGMDAQVYALAVSGTDLYAGGYFSTAGGVPANYIAKWDGSAWSALGSGMTLYYGQVYALAVSGTNLYAGGSFTTAGGVSAKYIAKWDGSTWSALGSGMNNDVWALVADGAERLFVGGEFSMAGTNLSFYIAEAILLPSAPTILKSPQTQTAEAGATMHLAVKAAGEPPPAYQWYFNGTNLLSCASSHLVLTNMLLSQSGAYMVVITNAVGAVTSAPVMVNVIQAVERRPVPGVTLMGEAGSLMNVDYANLLGATPNWLPLDTVTLASPSQYWFDVSDPLPPQRFYRTSQMGKPLVHPPVLDLHMVPAITVTGSVGGSVRVDGINRYGPTDAWFTLGTVTLTNTSQLYFDVSAPGQPERLYRLVPIP